MNDIFTTQTYVYSCTNSFRTAFFSVALYTKKPCCSRSQDITYTTQAVISRYCDLNSVYSRHLVKAGSLYSTAVKKLLHQSWLEPPNVIVTAGINLNFNQNAVITLVYYSNNGTKLPSTDTSYSISENLTALMSMLSSGVGARFWASFGTSFLYYSIRTFSMQTVTTFNMKSPCNAHYQRIRESGRLSPVLKVRDLTLWPPAPMPVGRTTVIDTEVGTIRNYFI